MTSTENLVVLHIGDDAEFNPELHKRFCSLFTIIQPTLEERQRPAFLQALKNRKWDDFHAVYTPHWDTGGEMRPWDRDLVPLLPKPMKIFASAGASYNWADVDVLAEYAGSTIPKIDTLYESSTATAPRMVPKQ